MKIAFNLRVRGNSVVFVVHCSNNTQTTKHGAENILTTEMADVLYQIYCLYLDMFSSTCVLNSLSYLLEKQTQGDRCFAF